jgi:hypothetical protein
MQGSLTFDPPMVKRTETIPMLPCMIAPNKELLLTADRLPVAVAVSPFLYARRPA